MAEAASGLRIPKAYSEDYDSTEVTTERRPLMRRILTLIAGIAMVATVLVLPASAATSVDVSDLTGPSHLEVMGGWVYFNAKTPDTGRELWRSNGVAIQLVADINPGPNDSHPKYLEAMNGWVYFNAETPDTGRELWRSNGVATQLVADINTGPDDSNPGSLEAMNGWVYFQADTLEFGRELWRSNGKTTELVSDISTGPDGSRASYLVAMNGWVYFSADTFEFGIELWRSNGEITELVEDVYVGAADSTPRYLEESDGWVYFAAKGYFDKPWPERGLWRTDGVATEPVFAIDVCGAGPGYLEGFDGWLYFCARGDTSTGFELWRSNGATTELVADINIGSGHSSPDSMEAMGEWVFFRATTPDTGRELWRTNGETTELVADINTGSESSMPSSLEEMHGWVYFGARTADTDSKLRRTNGTVTTEVISLTHLINDVIDQVRTFDLANGLSNSLERSLTTAIGLLEDAKVHNNVAAINELEALLHRVNPGIGGGLGIVANPGIGAGGGGLTAEEADLLSVSIDNIIKTWRHTFGG
jgi:ELWxxDGT repeat protein